MSTPKVISIALLGMFLSLSLVVFGFLLTINMTALNANFVTSRLDDLPLSALLEEAELGKINEENPELADFIEDTIIENETELKEQAGEATHIVYDYLKGQGQSLDLALVLKDTILDPDFTVSIIEKTELTPLVKELINDMMADAELPYDLSIEPYIDDIADKLEPWLKVQAAAAIPPVYNYILGFSQDTGFTISLEQPTIIIRDTLKQEFLQSPPTEFAGLPADRLEEEFDAIFNDLAGDIPAEIDIGAEFITGDVQADVAQPLADAEEALTEARRYIGYFNLVYGLLIGFILLLIAGIILIYREVRGATRILGTTFLTYGIINLIAVFVARGLASPPIARLDIPQSLQTWLIQLTNSSLMPLLILAIVFLIIGAILLTASFVYRRRQTAIETETPL